MSIDIPLDKMTLADKLEVMELIWEDLSKHSSNLPSPEWHKEVLAERQLLVAEGKVKLVDWDSAIADLRKEIHGDPNT